MQKEKDDHYEERMNDIISQIILAIHESNPLHLNKKYSFSLSFEFEVDENGFVHDVGTDACVKFREIVIN